MKGHDRDVESFLVLKPGAITAGPRHGVRIAYRHSRVNTAAGALFLLSIEGRILPQNEPLPILVEALKRQRDHAASAEELRYIESVLQCLADEPEDVTAEKNLDREDEQEDALMWVGRQVSRQSPRLEAMQANGQQAHGCSHDESRGWGECQTRHWSPDINPVQEAERLQVPDPYASVGGAGDNKGSSLPLRHRQRRHPISVPGQRSSADSPALLQVPDADASAGAAGYDH